MPDHHLLSPVTHRQIEASFAPTMAAANRGTYLEALGDSARERAWQAEQEQRRIDAAVQARLQELLGQPQSATGATILPFAKPGQRQPASFGQPKQAPPRPRR